MTKELTDQQIYDIIEQYVAIKVDRMSTRDLIEHVTQDLTDWYHDFTLDELKEYIIEMEHTFDNLDSGQELYDELVDNVISNPTPVINNQGGQS